MVDAGPNFGLSVFGPKLAGKVEGWNRIEGLILLEAGDRAARGGLQ